MGGSTVWFWYKTTKKQNFNFCHQKTTEKFHNIKTATTPLESPSSMMKIIKKHPWANIPHFHNTEPFSTTCLKFLKLLFWTVCIWSRKLHRTYLKTNLRKHSSECQAWFTNGWGIFGKPQATHGGFKGGGGLWLFVTALDQDWMWGPKLCGEGGQTSAKKYLHLGQVRGCLDLFAGSWHCQCIHAQTYPCVVWRRSICIFDFDFSFWKK